MATMTAQDRLDLVDLVDEDLLDQIEMVRELSEQFRRDLLRPENKDYVPASYCAEFLDCLDSFI